MVVDGTVHNNIPHNTPIVPTMVRPMAPQVITTQIHLTHPHMLPQLVPCSSILKEITVVVIEGVASAVAPSPVEAGVASKILLGVVLLHEDTTTRQETVGSETPKTMLTMQIMT